MGDIDRNHLDIELRRAKILTAQRKLATIIIKYNRPCFGPYLKRLDEGLAALDDECKTLNYAAEIVEAYQKQ